MSEIYKARPFTCWAKKAEITDAALIEAVEEMRRGLIDADLGGGICKKRVALQGRGKRGGARTVLATNRDDRWFYLYGFAKNEKDTLSPDELSVARETGETLLRCTGDELNNLVERGTLEKIL